MWMAVLVMLVYLVMIAATVAGLSLIAYQIGKCVLRASLHKQEEWDCILDKIPCPCDDDQQTA